MCEHRQIESIERIIYKNSPLGTMGKHSFYETLKIRHAAWMRLLNYQNKGQFHDMTLPLKLNDTQKEHLWLLISYCSYHLPIPSIFFDFLMDVVIEERATLRSFSTAEALRKWPRNPVPQNFKDNFLLFLYLAMRDGERAFSFLEDLEAL